MSIDVCKCWKQISMQQNSGQHDYKHRLSVSNVIIFFYTRKISWKIYCVMRTPKQRQNQPIWTVVIIRNEFSSIGTKKQWNCIVERKGKKIMIKTHPDSKEWIIMNLFCFHFIQIIRIWIEKKYFVTCYVKILFFSTEWIKINLHG